MLGVSDNKRPSLVDRDKVATISCLGPPGAVLGASYHKRPKLVDLDREGWYTPQGGYGPTSRASRLCWQSAMSKDPSCVISTARGSVPLKAAMISRFGPVFSAAYRAARGGTIMTPFSSTVRSYNGRGTAERVVPRWAMSRAS